MIQHDPLVAYQALISAFTGFFSDNRHGLSPPENVFEDDGSTFKVKKNTKKMV